MKNNKEKLHSKKKHYSETKLNDSLVIREGDVEYGTKLNLEYKRICNCQPTHINCMTPKDCLKSQLGVWEFFYEKRDIRDKQVHPATFPISLSRKIIELFSHKVELILDPFGGSGTTLVAAPDTNLNAVEFNLQKIYYFRIILY